MAARVFAPVGEYTLSLTPLGVFSCSMVIPAGVFGLGTSSGSNDLVRALPNLLVTGSLGKDAVAFLRSG